MQSLDIFSLSWALAFFVVLFAAFIRGVAGFGFALVLAPVLLLIIGPKSAVVVILLLGLITHILALRYDFRNIYLKGIIPMSVGSLLGIPLGIWIITVISPPVLKILIGCVTVCFAIPLALGFTNDFKRERLACGLSGFVSGTLCTSTSLGGPPVVLLMHNQNWRKEVIHSSLSAYFLFVNSCSLVALSISGLINTQIKSLP